MCLRMSMMTLVMVFGIDWSSEQTIRGRVKCDLERKAPQRPISKHPAQRDRSASRIPNRVHTLLIPVTPVST